MIGARSLSMLLAIAALGSGCAWASASSYEYGTYRRVRTETTLDKRLTAASAYLAAYPNGAYAPSVRTWFARTEDEFFTSHAKSVAGLEAYLAALPDGSHGAKARSLPPRVERASLMASLLAAAKLTEERLAAAAASCATARRDFSTWIAELSDPATYTVPIAEGSADLVSLFSATEPQPVCYAADPPETGQVCTKEIALGYQIPVKPNLVEREAAFLLTIELDERGVPRSAHLEGEGLFSRIEEAAGVRLLQDRGDDRATAVDRTLSLVSSTFATRVDGSPTCARELGPAEVMHLECRGVRVLVFASSAPGELDGIAFDPVSVDPEIGAP
ncbi:MAG: hypothetical protein U0271_43280 [Polyangiaceae bacterium]